MERLIKAHERKLSFLKEAIAEEAYLRVPLYLTEERWVKWRNITGIYEGSNITFDSLGEMYGLTGQFIKQIRDRCLERLYENCSLSIRKKYTLKEILVRKTSLIQAGVGEPGQKKAQAFKRQIEKEEDNKKLQEILDSRSDTSLKKCLNRPGKPPLLLSLRNTLRQAGYHFVRLDPFVKTLQKEGIPLRGVKGSMIRQTYWVILAKRQEAALKAVSDNPGLQPFKENPVKLISGIAETLPTTHEFRFSGQYQSVWKFIFDKVGWIGNESIEQFLAGCPVPVFCYRGTCSFPLDRQEELAAFIKEKYG